MSRINRTQGVVRAAGLSLLIVAAPSAAWCDQLPQSVTATYKVSFAGVEIGWFKYQASLDGDRYNASGKAKIRLLFGGLKWDGTMRGSGRLDLDGPRPATYRQHLESKRKLVFNTKRKTKRAAITFRNGRVQKSDISPPLKTGKDRAPFRDAHLVGVLDPIAAVLALTVDSGTRNPCNRRLAIFDGRQRMDLVFTYKKRVRIKARDEQPTRAFACGIRYVPIAGHKIKDKNQRQMASQRNITMILRAVPGARVFIPYQVSVPTVAGTAVIRADEVDIITRSQRRIALRG